ncbi:hypothetical protein RSAG8_07647, partial [Rhizoctonia solani AG-8 WAC10335]
MSLKSYHLEPEVPEVLISDHDIERISRCAPVPSIDQLRRYLIKWNGVNYHLESMWDALREGVYALSSTPDITTPAPTQPNPTQPSSQTASGKNLKAPRKSRHDKPDRFSLQTPGASLSSHKPRKRPTRTSKRPTASQALPAPSRGWWHDYMPERNYEVQHNVTVDDFRRMFLSPLRELPQRKHVSIPTIHSSIPSVKCAQLNSKLVENHFITTAIHQPSPTRMSNIRFKFAIPRNPPRLWSHLCPNDPNDCSYL